MLLLLLLLGGYFGGAWIATTNKEKEANKLNTTATINRQATRSTVIIYLIFESLNCLSTQRRVDREAAATLPRRKEGPWGCYVHQYQYQLGFCLSS